MKCPVCIEPELLMSDRQGIEIDYCPKCRGVWLDRGELDKLIDRSVAGQEVPEPRETRTPFREDDDRYRPNDRYGPTYRDDDDDYRHGRKRKRGLLGDIFDFD